MGDDDSISFIRYNEDDDTELKLELPVTVHVGGSRYSPRVRVEGDYDCAWQPMPTEDDPEAGQWVDLTEDEQEEASEAIAEYEREEQAKAKSAAECAAEDAWDRSREPW